MYFDFQHLKIAVPIEQVLAQKRVLHLFKRRPDKLIGPCVIHGGDNQRAFVVTISKNLWFCFTKCNAGGDVIELVKRLDHLTDRQCAQYLASIASPWPDQYGKYRLNPTQKPFLPFTKCLYLDHAHCFLKNKSTCKDTAAYFEAGAYYGQGFLEGCIAVRLHDPLGNPLGYAGRRLQSGLIESSGKWKFPKGMPKSKILYNYHRIQHQIHRSVLVVECPWSVMRLAQIGIPAVALLGVHLSEVQREILKLAPKIILMLDGDNAGKIAAIRINKILQSFSDVRIVNLPPGLDPDDLSNQQLAAYVMNVQF